MRKIFLFGDSIAAGRGIPKQRSYFSIITTKIQNLLPDRISFFDLAVPGTTLEDISKFMLEEIIHRVKIGEDKFLVILAAGLNDVLAGVRQGKSNQEISKNILAIISDLTTKISASGGKSLVLAISPVHIHVDGNSRLISSTITSVNHSIRDYISQSSQSDAHKFVEHPTEFETNPDSFLLSDKLHINVDGHSKIAKIIYPFVNNIIPNLINYETFLHNIYDGLSKDELQKRIEVLHKFKISDTSLFMGIDREGKYNYDAVLGGICIRPYIKYGLGFNEIYQALVPILVAKKLSIKNCTLIIPDREELRLSNASSEVAHHCDLLMKCIVTMATEVGVNVYPIRTSDINFQNQMSAVFKDIEMELSPKESMLFSRVYVPKDTKETHTEERVHVTREFLKYHTSVFTQKVLGYGYTLIVEDFAQYNLYQAANHFISNDLATNFVPFIPLPCLKGNKSDFAASEQERIIFPLKTSLTTDLVCNTPDDVLFLYCEIARTLKTFFSENQLSNEDWIFCMNYCFSHINDLVQRESLHI
ncbi:MAG: SGNH/GDSL hydrolase family protein [bacterium]|nr:SGNH/GDSL hydrolase family protein [bacterium]